MIWFLFAGVFPPQPQRPFPPRRAAEEREREKRASEVVDDAMQRLSELKFNFSFA